jgi:hypothetical protein
VGLDFKEMYLYSAAGLMVGKRLRLSPNPAPQFYFGEPETADLEATFTYDSEGRYLGPQNHPSKTASTTQKSCPSVCWLTANRCEGFGNS